MHFHFHRVKSRCMAKKQRINAEDTQEYLRKLGLHTYVITICVYRKNIENDKNRHDAFALHYNENDE